MHYDDIQKIVGDCKPYVAISIFIPPEILAAFDLQYIPIEQFGAMIYQLLNADKRIANAPVDMKAIYLEQTGVCSISAGILAAIHYGILPHPDFILASTHQCDDSLKCMEMLAKNTGKDMFVLDIPFSKNKTSLHYIETQLKDLVKFVSYKTNKPYDKSKLQKSIEFSNTANDYRRKILRMMKQRPQLLKMAELVQIYPLYTKFGRPDSVEIYQTLYDELLSLLGTEMRTYSNQQFKILWLGSIPITNHAFLSYLENDLTLNIVSAELMSHADFDEMDAARPFESLAQKLISFPTVGPIHNRLKWIKKAINEHHVDGVVHFSQIACRDFGGGVRHVTDLCRSIDLPFLELNADAGDKLNFPIMSLKTRLEAFVELLKTRTINDKTNHAC
jgi:benzoyl-CoA reductase/2-hydroxyglutaryl-CoA dehydratase subunit BcrC/BadD/HgdB